jgi:hypothetical protein
MIDRQHDLPITKQATALGISRGCVYYLPRSVSSADLGIMRRIDERHLDFPFAGSRMLRDLLNAEGIQIGRQHVATLMRRMGIGAIYRWPNTTREKLMEPVADNTIATTYNIYFDYFLPCIPVNGRILKLGGRFVTREVCTFFSYNITRFLPVDDCHRDRIRNNTRVPGELCEESLYKNYEAASQALL